MSGSSEEVGLQYEDQVEVVQVRTDLTPDAPEQLRIHFSVGTQLYHNRGSMTLHPVILVMSVMEPTESRDMEQYLVSQSLVVKSSPQKKPTESAVVVVLMFESLHELEHVHLDGFVLDVWGTETLDRVLVNPLVRILVVQQLESVLERDHRPGPQYQGCHF